MCRSFRAAQVLASLQLHQNLCDHPLSFEVWHKGTHTTLTTCVQHCCSHYQNCKQLSNSTRDTHTYTHTYTHTTPTWLHQLLAAVCQSRQHCQCRLMTLRTLLPLSPTHMVPPLGSLTGVNVSAVATLSHQASALACTMAAPQRFAKVSACKPLPLCIQTRHSPPPPPHSLLQVVCKESNSPEHTPRRRHQGRATT